MKTYSVESDYSVLVVLGILAADVKSHGMGVLEEELVRKSGLDAQKVLGHLWGLVEHEFVVSRLTQLGTSGPYGHYYKLAKDVTFRVEKQ